MTDSWANIIGNYINLGGNPIRVALGHVSYLYILKQIDIHLENSLDDNEWFKCYETLHMALNPKKKIKDDENSKGYTYIGDRIVIKKDADGKSIKDEKGNIIKETEKDVELPVKKYVNITVPYRTGLAFLLQKYVHECVSCFNDGNHMFKGKEYVLEQVYKYAQSNIPNPVFPAIIRAVDTFKVELIIDYDYEEFSQFLYDKCKGYFKGKEDQVPQEQLRLIVTTFIKFIKMVSIYVADLIYEKHQVVNNDMLFGVLRIINSNIFQYDASFTESLFVSMKKYIEFQRPTNEETESPDGETKSKKTPRAKKDPNEPPKPRTKRDSTKKPTKKKDSIPISTDTKSEDVDVEDWSNTVDM